MAIVMKDNKEVRVPGSAIAQEKQRKGILGIADAMSLSDFRRMPLQDRLIFLKDALKAKGEFEKSAKYHEALIKERFGTGGIKDVLIKAATKKVAELQKRLPTHGYPVYWVKNPDIFDAEDMLTRGMNPEINGNDLPYIARLVQLSLLPDGSKGAFTTREIIDTDSRGRQFRWRAFAVGKNGIPKEVAKDHAYEMERPVIMELAKKGDRLVVKGTVATVEI